jgi:hypothetical protein
MRAPQWAKATEILSVEKPVEKMAVGGPENQEKPWEKPGKTRKNQEKLGKTMGHSWKSGIFLQNLGKSRLMFEN